VLLANNLTLKARIFGRIEKQPDYDLTRRIVNSATTLVLNPLECADRPALWSVATKRDHDLAQCNNDLGGRPPWAKAPTGRRTPGS